MANTDLYNAKNEKVGEVELPGGLFGGRISPALLHEVSSISAANERAGTRAHKTRGAVSGGGRKPWKQKGTGRARQGSTRSPQWRHGGTVFGPLPKDYDVRMPQSKRRAALRAALAWKLRDGLVHVVEEFPDGRRQDQGLGGLARRGRLARRRRAARARRRGRPSCCAPAATSPTSRSPRPERLQHQRPRGPPPPRADPRGAGRHGGAMGKVSDPYRIIRTPLLTEKCHDLKEQHNQVAFRVDPTATKTEIKEAVERIFKAKVAAVNVMNVARQEEAPRQERRPPLRLEEGDRHAEARREDRDHRRGVIMAIKKYRADLSRASATGPTSATRSSTGGQAAPGPDREPEEDRRAQQPRQGHRLPPRRRAQAARTGSIDFRATRPALPAKVVQRRVRPEPHRAHRARELRRRGEALRLAPTSSAVGDKIVSGRRRRHQGRQLAAAQEHPARHGDPQHRAAARAGRRSSCAAPARSPSWWRKRGRVRPGQAALGRGPDDPRGVHGDDRPGRQRRAGEGLPRQGRAARAGAGAARTCAAWP